MGIFFKNNSKVLKSEGKVFGYSEDIILSFSNTNQVPPLRGSGNNGQVSFFFDIDTSISIDYGNGVTGFYPTKNKTVVILTGDSPASANEYNPYIYPDALIINRTIKISYRKDLLSGFYISNSTKFIVSDFNFKFYEHRRLNLFNFAGVNAFVLKMDFKNISTNTNPLLKTLGLNFFNSASPYYATIPLEVLQIYLNNLTVGTPAFGTGTFESTNLDKIATSPIATTLTSLSISGGNVMTDAQGLPPNFSTFPALKTLDIFENKYTQPPSVVNTMSFLTRLGIGNSSFYVNHGNISNLVNIETLSFLGSVNIYQAGNFPSYYDTFIKLRSISFQRCNTTNQSVTTSLINMVYDLINRNASKSGLATLPFRGMIINLTTDSTSTAIDGVVQQPSGYIAGSNNGSPANAGEKIWVLRNQYATTITLTL